MTTTAQKRRGSRSDGNVKLRKELKREFDLQLAEIREDFRLKMDAFVVADRSAWATSILFACGFAVKEMLLGKTPEGFGQILYRDDTGDDVVRGFDNDTAEQITQEIIGRAVEVLQVIDKHGLGTEDEINAYLNEGILPDEKVGENEPTG